MKTYPLQDGDTLVVSVNDTAWETIKLEKKDFDKIEAATAQELAAVLQASGIVGASVDAQGCLILAAPSPGGHTSLAIDLAKSTAAAPLGLTTGSGYAQGRGLRAARLAGLASGPFPLHPGAKMTIVVDGRSDSITFDKGITEGQATADEVAKLINAKLKGIATASLENRVILTSPTIGLGSSMEVQPGPEGPGKEDAAAILGFVGPAAYDQPYDSEPARMACRGQSAGLQVVNLTASPVEINLSTGMTVLSPRTSLTLSASEAASSHLHRLIKQGIVRLMSATGEAKAR
jgi:hypothetical protein